MTDEELWIACLDRAIQVTFAGNLHDPFAAHDLATRFYNEMKEATR